MNSALAAALGLAVSIVLIIRKLSPVYALILGALLGGLLSGWGLDATVREMVTGVKDIAPAIVRILAAGVLTGMLVVTGAAERISLSIISGLGRKQVYLALALSAFVLTAMGVFIDVAVITIAPIALFTGRRLGLPVGKLLLAMIGGGKCGNIISPNPNTIIAAENYGAPLSSVMAAGIVPALIGLAVTVYVIVPMFPNRGVVCAAPSDEGPREDLPSLLQSIVGPVVTVSLLGLRPIFGVNVDPVVALPAGGLAGILSCRCARRTGECLDYGLGKMSGIAILLVGTGTLAGIIKASEIKDVLISLMSIYDTSTVLLAPLSGILMSAASASTTAGATIASASFASAVLGTDGAALDSCMVDSGVLGAGGIGTGVSAVWAASMTNAGATVLDHLPHGSFFHATGGSVGMNVKERLRLIPYESLVGLVLTAVSVAMYLIV